MFRLSRHASLLPRTALVSCAAAMAVALLSTALNGQTFRTAVNLRVLQVAVSDERGQRVAGLSRHDFTVYEDGVARPIEQFSADRVPVSLGILMDASGSMEGRRFQDAQGALGHLLERFTGDDRIFLAAFNTSFHLLVSWTADHTQLLRGLAGITPNGGTYLYSSVSKALPILNDGPNRKKALVIISDGDDNEKMAGLNRGLLLRAVQQAQQSEAVVYTIGIGVAKPSPEAWFALGDDARRRLVYAPAVDIDQLKQLSDPTGGYTQLVPSSADLASTIISIADDLSAQYTLGFESAPPDGRFHALRVTTRDPKDTIRTKTGYESR